MERKLDETIEWIQIMSEKSKLDKFQQFYNSGKILYSSMTFEKRREWREELSEILVTARANLSAADDIDREEGAKLSPEGRKWLVTNDESGLNSDSLLQPKLRKERMSKMDKLAADMKELGLSMADINSALGEVSKVQTGGSVTTSHTREMKDNVSFVKESKPNGTNTQESLLADISSSLVEGLKEGRSPDDLESAAKTAGHIGRKLLNQKEETKEEVKEETSQPTKFDPSKLVFRR